MIALAVTVLVVFLLICISELLWRWGNFHPEYTRKFVHISVGSFVAFWPLFLTRTEIAGLSVAFLAVVGISKYFNLFKAMRSVQRPTWGEVFFAVAVGTLAFVAQNGWIYLAALLHMSLADGLAAVLGTRYGRRTQYHILGHPKSVAGTLAFLAVSLAILSGYALFTPAALSLWFIPLALAAMSIENIAVRGLDDLLVPLLVAVCLNVLR